MTAEWFLVEKVYKNVRYLWFSQVENSGDNTLKSQVEKLKNIMDNINGSNKGM